MANRGHRKRKNRPRRRPKKRLPQFEAIVGEDGVSMVIRGADMSMVVDDCRIELSDMTLRSPTGEVLGTVTITEEHP